MNIVTGLAAADAANAAFFRERGQSYDKRLAELDRWVRAEIDKVPPAQRRAITAHDSFRYFAAAYGVQFFAPRGFTTDSDPSARDVAALIRQVREQKIKALFVENMSNPGLIDQIARESDAVVGPRLYSDALSAPNGPAPACEAMVRHTVTALVAGMLKNCPPFRRSAPPPPASGGRKTTHPPPPSYGGGREGEGHAKGLSKEKIMSLKSATATWSLA